MSETTTIPAGAVFTDDDTMTDGYTETVPELIARVASKTTLLGVQVLAVLLEEGKATTPARIAGELGKRSQDVGRVIANLKRDGLVHFEVGPRAGTAGYVLTVPEAGE